MGEANTTTAPPVSPEILAWAAEQDFRRMLRNCINALRIAPTARSGSRPLWAVVADTLCIGSTYASRYCLLFGFDPDEKVKS